jgi:hypothetical protein
MITELNGGIARLWPLADCRKTRKSRNRPLPPLAAAEKHAVNIPTNPPAVIRGTALLLYYRYLD